ncbi:MAG: hypothetical protein ACRBN8_19475 [Nannocystales bacterium]
MRSRLAAVAAVFLLVGCTERFVQGDGSQGQDGECPPSVAIESGVSRTPMGQCTFEGEDEQGLFHVLVCSSSADAFEGCTWFIEGIEQCECDVPDFSNVCANGVPVCPGWLDAFDLGAIEYE